MYNGSARCQHEPHGPRMPKGCGLLLVVRSSRLLSTAVVLLLLGRLGGVRALLLDVLVGVVLEGRLGGGTVRLGLVSESRQLLRVIGLGGGCTHASWLLQVFIHAVEVMQKG